MGNWRPEASPRTAAHCARGVIAIATILLPFSSEADAQTVDRAQFAQWGLEVYAETVETLGLSRSPLFAESASLAGTQFGGAGGQAYVWPLSTQFRVQNSLARLDAAEFAPLLRTFSDQLHADYWRSAGGGYRSGVTASSDVYYDDNAHLVVALTEAYEITGDPVFLSRAEDTYDFVISGEDGAGGGGIYFREGDFSFKDSISTLQGARGALMLFQATGDENYLQDASRLYEWAEETTQQPDGLFMEKLFLTGPNAGTVGNFTLVNSAGIGISTNLEFYDATGGAAYLAEAQRMAQRSLTRYFQPGTGRINDEGFWAFELTDALADLHARDGDPRWIAATDRALRWLHDNKQDPNGHYGRFWGREGPQFSELPVWHLNDQASVARGYLHIATVPEPATFVLGLGGAIALSVLLTIARRGENRAGKCGVYLQAMLQVPPRGPQADGGQPTRSTASARQNGRQPRVTVLPGPIGIQPGPHRGIRRRRSLSGRGRDLRVRGPEAVHPVRCSGADAPISSEMRSAAYEISKLLKPSNAPEVFRNATVSARGPDVVVQFSEAVSHVLSKQTVTRLRPCLARHPNADIDVWSATHLEVVRYLLTPFTFAGTWVDD